MQEPGEGLQTTDCTAQLSVATGAEKLTTAQAGDGQTFCGVNAVTFAGQVSFGGSASATVTVNEQVDWFAKGEASVAVQVTVVVPFKKVEPDGGAQATVTPAQLSVAVTE